MATNFETNQECFKVSGKELFSRIREIIQEGNARKVIIKNEEGKTIKEFSLKMGAIGLVLAPQLAAICAMTAMAKDWTIIVEKKVKQEE